MTSKKLPEHIKDTIRNPNFASLGNKRTVLFLVIKELIAAGVGAQECASIISDPDNGISEYVRERGGYGYAWRRVVGVAQYLQEFSRDQKGNILPTASNIRIALAKLELSLTYNEFDGNFEVDGLDGYGPTLDDDAINRIWLRMAEELQCHVQLNLMRTVIVDDARNHFRFHPVRDYLDGLEWDGTERLDEWLPTFAGAVDSEYVRAVGSIVLIAACRRVQGM